MWATASVDCLLTFSLNMDFHIFPFMRLNAGGQCDSNVVTQDRQTWARRVPAPLGGVRSGGVQKKKKKKKKKISLDSWMLLDKPQCA